MRIKVFRYNGLVARSLLSASCIKEIETEERPVDHEDFALAYGGDFIVIDEDEDIPQE